MNSATSGPKCYICIHILKFLRNFQNINTVNSHFVSTIILWYLRGCSEKTLQEVASMGEIKAVAQAEMDLLRDKLRAQAAYRRNISFLKREVQREASEFKKLRTVR